jgi:hypothetical protein
MTKHRQFLQTLEETLDLIPLCRQIDDSIIGFLGDEASLITSIDLEE